MDELKPFDFGDFTQDDFRKIRSEFESRGYDTLKIDQRSAEDGGQLAQKFLQFIIVLFRNLGLMDDRGRVAPRVGVSGFSEKSLEDQNLLRDVWNFRAEDWAVVESPEAYMITMRTLMEFFRGAGKDKDETVLSLGSGPGLYETFLALLFRKVKQTKKMRFVCLDGAPEMSLWQKKILPKAVEAFGETERLRTVRMLSGDMADLPMKDGSVQQIICNNALQWVKDWQKALKEMARVMDPSGLGYLYLFVHLHPMSMRGVTDKGEKIEIESGKFTIEELLDTLESNRFVIHRMRQIGGRQGTGQFGAKINRVFVWAKFQAKGEIKSWRQMNVQSSITPVRF